MKLPNGYGSVVKLSGKRRKPWAVRITKGWIYNPEQDKMIQERPLLGTYATKQEAINALANYNQNPYDIKTDSITLKELYELWTEEYFKSISESATRTIAAAWRYCSIIERMKVKDIRIYHLKGCINDGYIIGSTGKKKGQKILASPSTKERMKSMFNLLFDYACEHEAAEKNYARMFSLDDSVAELKEENKKENIPFSDEEIKILWDNVDEVPFVDMILIDIYSGWRPQELATLKNANIDLSANTMFGGLKTRAGKNRFVPIHPLIRPLIEKRYDVSREYLFNDENGQQGTSMTYDKYRGRFIKAMNRLKMDHHPHECRHTFITKAKAYDLDEYILKIIVGHTITDITERTYTHRTMEQLQAEILKIKK